MPLFISSSRKAQGDLKKCRLDKFCTDETQDANLTYYLSCFLLNQPSVLFRSVFLGSILIFGFFLCCVFLNFFLSIVGDRDCYS